jgi:hypothetical protein
MKPAAIFISGAAANPLITRADRLRLLAEALGHREDPKWRAWLEKLSDPLQQRAVRWHLLLAE